MSMFDTPAKGDRINWDDLNGTLLIFHVHSVETGIETSYGPSDAVKADVTAVDGAHAGEKWEGALVFPRVLQGALASKVGSGKPVLGRLGKGTAKPGQSAPWVLDDPTDADIAAGVAYMEAQAKLEQPFA